MGALKNFINDLKTRRTIAQLLIPKGQAVLTKEFLLNTPQNLRQQEIAYHIFDHKIDHNITEEFEQVSKMPKSYQMINTLWHLQGEVCNGGYYQYFDNFDNCNQIKKPYYDLTIDCLKMIGCTDLCDDYIRALWLYLKCEELKEGTERDRFAEEMEKLDEKFFTNQSFFIQAIDNYISVHLDNFVS